MGDCKSTDDAFVLAASGHMPMNVVAVVQHTSGEYLGLMEDHFEGRRIRFQYFRPFAGGGKLPATDVPAGIRMPDTQPEEAGNFESQDKCDSSKQDTLCLNR